MKGAVASLAAVLAVAVAPARGVHAAEVPATRPAVIQRAEFVQGRLWLLQDDGKLSSTAPTDRDRRPELLPEQVRDFCVDPAGRLLAVTGERDAAALTVRRRERSSWMSTAVIPAAGERVLGLACADSPPLLLTSRRLITLTPGGVQSVALRGDAFAHGIAGVTSLAATREALLVGLNAGEWGGGVRRVDRRTGEVSTIESNTSGELCGGPLNTACDPVNGVQPEPWRPECELAAVGLVHFSPRGRLVEICGRRVTRRFFSPFGEQRDRPGGAEQEPSSTVAFFGLRRQGDALWAVGIDGLYRVTRDEVAPPRPLPSFVERDGVRLSFAIPHLIVVLTTINQRLSISGQTPLLVAY